MQKYFLLGRSCIRGKKQQLCAFSSKKALWRLRCTSYKCLWSVPMLPKPIMCWSLKYPQTATVYITSTVYLCCSCKMWFFFSCFMHCESFHSSWIFFNFTSNIRLAGFVQNSSALCNLGEDCSVQVIHIVVTVLVEMDFNALNYVSCLSCFAFYKVTKAHAQSLCSGCENHFGLSVAFFILVTMSMVYLICIPTQLKLDAGDPNEHREYSWCNLRGKARLFKLHMFYLKFRRTQTIGHFSSM